jgi:hypothetical protein
MGFLILSLSLPPSLRRDGGREGEREDKKSHPFAWF